MFEDSFPQARSCGKGYFPNDTLNTDAALNLARVAAWLSDAPLAKTRSSPLCTEGMDLPAPYRRCEQSKRVLSGEHFPLGMGESFAIRTLPKSRFEVRRQTTDSGLFAAER